VELRDKGAEKRGSACEKNTHFALRIDGV